MTVISTSSDRLLKLLRSAKDMFFDENSHLSNEEKEQSWAKRRSELTLALGSGQQGPVIGAPDFKKQQSVGLLVCMESLSKLIVSLGPIPYAYIHSSRPTSKCIDSISTNVEKEVELFRTRLFSLNQRYLR